MTTTPKNPITGFPCQKRSDLGDHYYLLDEHLGNCLISHYIASVEDTLGIFSDLPKSLVYSAYQLLKYETKRRQLRKLATPIFTSHHYESALSDRYSSEIERRQFKIIPFEDLIRIAQGITMRERLRKTTELLVEQERSDPDRFYLWFRDDLKHSLDKSDPTWPYLNGALPFEFFAYASHSGMVSLLERILREEGHLVADNAFPYRVCRMSSSAHIDYGGELFERDRSHSRGFLVCRFINDLDDLQRDLYIGNHSYNERRYEILRVSDHEHIGKIDDLIIELLQTSDFVVVDLQQHNFNVGFETGYAMALGKPIILTHTGEQPLIPPFDLSTMNTLNLDPKDLEGSREKLLRRISIALGHDGHMIG